MNLGSRNLRFWTSAKNMTMVIKTPGGSLLGGGVYDQGEAIISMYACL